MLDISESFDHNHIPIFVFDGKPPKEKLNIIEKRNKEKQEAEKKYILLEEKLITVKDENLKNDILENIQDLKKKFVRLKRSDIINVRNLLDAFGVYHIEAIGEADELCARLVIKKYAYFEFKLNSITVSSKTNNIKKDSN